MHVLAGQWAHWRTVVGTTDVYRLWSIDSKWWRSQKWKHRRLSWRRYRRIRRIRAPLYPYSSWIRRAGYSWVRIYAILCHGKTRHPTCYIPLHFSIPITTNPQTTTNTIWRHTLAHAGTRSTDPYQIVRVPIDTENIQLYRSVCKFSNCSGFRSNLPNYYWMWPPLTQPECRLIWTVWKIDPETKLNIGWLTEEHNAAEHKLYMLCSASLVVWILCAPCVIPCERSARTMTYSRITTIFVSAVSPGANVSVRNFPKHEPHIQKTSD